MLKFLALLTLFFSSFVCAHASEFAQLEKLKKQGAQVSAMIVNLNDHKVMASLDETKRLSPASVSKLVLAADALETWGPDKQFVTRVYRQGNVKNGVLNGDLILEGAGDPYLTNEKLWFLATDVWRAGIRKITGRVVINDSLFGAIEQDKTRQSKKSRSHNAYDAPLSAAAVNFSVLGIMVAPGSSTGNSAIVSIEPYDLPSVQIENHVTTSSAQSKNKISVERISKGNKDLFVVSGSIAQHAAPQRIYRSVSDPDRYAGEVFDAFLNHASVSTTHGISVQDHTRSNQAMLVSQVEGFPLDWQLKGLLEMSNNFIADMMLLNLSKGTLGQKKSNLKQSAQTLESYLEDILDQSKFSKQKSAQTPLILSSASGLTPDNRLSAQDVTSLLDHMYFNANAFPAFLNALPAPGQTGTLKNRFSKEKTTLRAKTGTLTAPVDVVSLAGYFRLRHGDWVAFAVLVNGTAQKPSFGIEHIRQAIDSDLEGFFD